MVQRELTLLREFLSTHRERLMMSAESVDAGKQFFRLSSGIYQSHFISTWPLIESLEQEVRAGDRFMPRAATLMDATFFPEPPGFDLEARILDLFAHHSGDLQLLDIDVVEVPIEEDWQRIRVQ